MNRTDISEKLKESLKCDTLLLVGDKSSFLHTTETMYQAADTTKTSILRLDDVGDVLVESPGKVAQSILLFCQGMGLLTSASSSERVVRLSRSLLFYQPQNWGVANWELGCLLFVCIKCPVWLIVVARGLWATAAMTGRRGGPACPWGTTTGQSMKQWELKRTNLLFQTQLKKILHRKGGECCHC